ncbi:hypothetical protein LCGC14_1284580 [marine sediment metagenome]|uniref:Uncharacterized protein n=1 Tax=marine sediment metagenome TaxID=412755 RepID=A0A0F9LFA6_9ZZZZ
MNPTLLIWLIALFRSQKKPSSKSRGESKCSPSVTNKAMTRRDETDAQFGRGKFAGKTGSPFIDKPFFNPWAPGGDFNK